MNFQCAIVELYIAKFLIPKSFASMDQLVQRVDFRPKGPLFDPAPGFLKVWLKKFLAWEDFLS